MEYVPLLRGFASLVSRLGAVQPDVVVPRVLLGWRVVDVRRLGLRRSADRSVFYQRADGDEDGRRGDVRVLVHVSFERVEPTGVPRW